MALAVNDIIQLSWQGRIFNQRILMVNDWRVTEAITGGNIWDQLAIIAEQFGDVANEITSAYLNMLPDNYVLEQVRAQVIYPTRFPYAADPVNAPGQSDPANIQNVAACFTRYTAKTGRDQIAVTHVGPLYTTDATGGIWDGTVLTDLAVLATTLCDPYSILGGTDNLVPTILHRSVNANPRWDDIVGFRLSNEVRTMRRRTVGRGE